MSNGSKVPNWSLYQSHDGSFDCSSAEVVIGLEWLPCIINVQSKRKSKRSHKEQNYILVCVIVMEIVLDSPRFKRIKERQETKDSNNVVRLMVTTKRKVATIV